MESVSTLIDKASKACGSDTKLAALLGVHRVAIAEMRSGKRKISPATAAELADIAGDDAREATIWAVIESAKGTRREGVLREILGKALAGGAVAALVFFCKAGYIDSTDPSKIVGMTLIDRVHTLYIV